MNYRLTKDQSVFMTQFINKIMTNFDAYFKLIMEKCWKNYKQLGTKKKGKKEVPNCVPK